MRHEILGSKIILILFGFILSGEVAVAGLITSEQLKNTYPDRYFQEILLPSGRTHYQSVGEGPVVILVHGVSGPLSVWDKTVPALVGAGYKVVRYDLLGRGFSERLEDSSYSLGTYLRQLEELIAALKLGPNVRLVGSSLGGVVTSEYTLQHPDSVAGLVLIGPAGFVIATPWTARLRELPLVGDMLTDLLGYGTILKQNDHYFVSGEMPSDLRPFVADQLSVPGTTEAILKTMKNAPVQSFVESYGALKDTGVPVGIIWGRQDATFPYENAAILTAVLPGAQLVTIENSGHLPQYEKFEEVNPALIKFERAFDSATARTGGGINPRVQFSRAVTKDLNPANAEHSTEPNIEQGDSFNAPFFQKFPSAPLDLELAPGVIKTYQFPTFYDQETLSAGLFLCDYDEAAKLLPSSLRPLSFGMGRAALMVSSFRYGKVRGIRPYNEVAIAILVQKPSQGDGGTLTFLREGGKNVTSYVVSMPVTSFENQIRGQKIWGLPKVVQEIDLRQIGNEFVTTVYDEPGQPYLEFRVPMTGKSETLDQSVKLYSELSGKGLESRSFAQGLGFTTMNAAVLFGAAGSTTGYAPLSLSASPAAAMLRRLKISPVPLKTVFSPLIQSVLSLPQASE